MQSGSKSCRIRFKKESRCWVDLPIKVILEDFFEKVSGDLQKYLSPTGKGNAFQMSAIEDNAGIVNGSKVTK